MITEKRKKRIEHILKQRKLQGITWDDLAKDLPIQGNSLRVAFTRGKADDYYLEYLENLLGISQSTTVNESNFGINDSFTISSGNTIYVCEVKQIITNN